MKSAKSLFIAFGLLMGQLAIAGGAAHHLSVDSLQIEESELELDTPTEEMLAFEEEIRLEEFARLTEQAYQQFVKELD